VAFCHREEADTIQWGEIAFYDVEDHRKQGSLPWHSCILLKLKSTEK
jgi:hypothetical protein